MRRTVTVLIVATVLLWGPAALGHRSPTTRLDGDPDEYQAKAIHNEADYVPWNAHRSGSGMNGTGRLAPESGIAAGGASIPGAWIPGAVMLGQRQAGVIWLRLAGMLRQECRGTLLWEVRLPGKRQISSGGGR